MSLPLFRSRRGVSVSRLGIAVPVLWTLATAAAQPSFTPLGDLPGGTFFSGADGLSSDGQVVVGSTQSSAGRQAFRWTRAGGMQGLGDFGPVGQYDSSARAASANGDVVAGEGRTAITRVAFRWTAATGLQPLGSLIPNGDSHARGASADGSVIVGLAGSATGSQAFRWTAAGMEGLGQFSGPNLYSDAAAVTPDGSVIVGRSDGVNGAEAYRWTAATGMQGLGDLPGGGFHSEARGISADGNVIVGFGNNATVHFEPAKWTTSSGWVGLGYLPNQPTHSYGWALALSADGSLIGGFSGRENLPETFLGFLWDAGHGMRDVKDVLIAAGVPNLTTWKLTNVTGISADGLTFSGNGINPMGQSEAWIATIPAPGSAAALALSAVLLRRRR